MKYVFAGDSWALKGFTEQNHNQGNTVPRPEDTRMADHWPWPYKLAVAPGQGNIAVLNQIVKLRIPSHMPIVWIWTEPGRDYGYFYPKDDPHQWMKSNNFWDLRKELACATIKIINQTISNPVAFVGGLSDFDIDPGGHTVLEPSWQSWIAQTLHSQHFKQGWGASDIGWRAVHNGVTPGRDQTLAWDDQIKEWCWWAEQGYFCHEHPTPRANQEFAEYLEPRVEKWLQQYEK